MLTKDKPRPAPLRLTATLGHIRKNKPSSKLQFQKNMKNYLTEQFALMDDLTKWLPLSGELTLEECEVVHDVAKELSLKVDWKKIPGGEKTDTFLVLSKKFASQDLFDYIWEKGGETWRYKLRAPEDVAPGL